MATRLKTLVALQLTNKKFFKKMDDWKKIVIFFMLRLLAVVLVTVVAYFVLFFISNIVYLKVNRNLLLFIVGITQLISIIANTNSLSDELYLSKDNNILFSFPARHNEIFFSKLIVFYISEFIKNLYFLIPVMIAFGFYLKMGVAYFANAIVLIGILPLVPVLLGAILSIPFMILKRAIKSIPALQAVFTTSVLGAVFYLLYRILSKLPVPLRILALYNSFIIGLEAFILKFNKALLYYYNVVNTLFGFRNIFDYLIMIGGVVFLGVMVYLLAMPLYFKIVSHYAERAIVKKHKKKISKRRSTFATFFNKEMKVIFRTPGKLSNYLSFVISFPLLTYVMNTIFSAINTNDVGSTLVIGLNIMISLVILTAANTISSTAISTEGQEFAVLKTAPSDTAKIAYAKILVNFIFSSIGIICGFVILNIITEITLWQLVVMFLIIIFVNTAHILWSFQLDINNPKLHDYITKGNTNNNVNVGKSLLVGIIISFVFALLSLFFMLENLTGGFVRILIIAVAFFAVRLILFISNLKVYFKRIEL